MVVFDTLKLKVTIFKFLNEYLCSVISGKQRKNKKKIIFSDLKKQKKIERNDRNSTHLVSDEST